MKKLWFRRKRYGWGWMPVSGEGWLVMLGFIAIVVFAAKQIAGTGSPRPIVLIVIATAALLWICYKKGEKPKWQWGSDEKK